MKSIITLIALSILFSSCLSNKFSNKTKEEVSLFAITDSVGFNFEDILPQNAPGLKSRGLLVGDAVNIAVNGIRFFIELDKKKYIANYTSGRNELYFYKEISDKGTFDVTSMQFDGVKLLRMVKDKEGNLDTALYISLRVDKSNPYDIINNSSFRFVIEDFKMNYSKAKIPGFRWYLPWSIIYKNRNKINLDMEVKVLSSWVSEGAQVNRGVEIGKFHINLRNIPLTNDTSIKEEYRKGVIGTSVSGSSFLVPRSYGFYYARDKELKHSFGQGKYNIAISVKESGRKRLIMKLVQDNSDVIIDEFGNTFLKMLPE